MDTHTFDGDRPIPSESEDQLGFDVIAKHIAEAIVTLSSPEGFVVGIEGAWGSGKSSLLNLTSEALGRQQNAPAVVRFSPWLISSREALLKELFSELLKACQSINPGEKKLKKRLQKYSGHLILAGKAAGEGIIGNTAQLMGDWLAGGSIEEQKAQLAQALRELKRKIVVFIDDLDRLDPGETAEVLRLVRAVADFPNVVYVLCYSREVLARNLATAFTLRKEQGAEYIEKIVQTSFSVPRPEAFELRKMFRKELETAFPAFFGPDPSPPSRRILDRLDMVIDQEGDRALKTPRQVVRAINSLRLYLTPVISQVDLPDMVWLQLVRLRSLAFFKWVETYMNEVAAIAGGATLTEEAHDGDLKNLLDLFKKLDVSSRDRRIRALALVLPGIQWHMAQRGTSNWRLYDALAAEVGVETLSPFIVDRRLGSPQHFRYYFALARPSQAISDREFEEFIDECEVDSSEAAKKFTAFSRQMGPQGRPMADAVLDRLHGEALARVPKASLPGLLLAIGMAMDDAAKTSGEGEFGEYWIWARARRVLANVLPLLDAEPRAQLLDKLARSGPLGWMTRVFRDEIFTHGAYGDKKKPESERLLTSKEFAQLNAVLLARYAALSTKALSEIPHCVHVLYAWIQSSPGNEHAVRAWVAERTRDASDLLLLLGAWRAWRAVNGQVMYTLNKSVISRFMDFAMTKQRLILLSEGENKALSERARTLLGVLREDEDG